VPRTPGDIRQGSSTVASVSGSTARSGGSAAAGGTSGRPGALERRSQVATGSSAPRPEPLDVDLGELSEHIGAVVRVGGLVVGLEPGAIVVNDGTARGRVELVGEAAAYLPLIEPDDAVNATGRVVLSGGRAEVSVSDPGGLLRVGDLGEPMPLGSGPDNSEPAALETVDRLQPASTDAGTAASGTTAGAGAVSTEVEGRASAGIALAAFEGPVGIGVVWLALASIVSVAMAAVRRQRNHRGLASRIAERLSAVAGSDRPRAT
jgi:hypothetical protein